MGFCCRAAVLCCHLLHLVLQGAGLMYCDVDERLAEPAAARSQHSQRSFCTCRAYSHSIIGTEVHHSASACEVVPAAWLTVSDEGKLTQPVEVSPHAGFLLRVVCNERLREELTAVHDSMVDALQVGGCGGTAPAAGPLSQAACSASSFRQRSSSSMQCWQCRHPSCCLGLGCMLASPAPQVLVYTPHTHTLTLTRACLPACLHTHASMPTSSTHASWLTRGKQATAGHACYQGYCSMKCSYTGAGCRFRNLLPCCKRRLGASCSCQRRAACSVATTPTPAAWHAGCSSSWAGARSAMASRTCAGAQQQLRRAACCAAPVPAELY